MDDEQEVQLNKLEDLVDRFKVCFRLLGKEEDENNNDDIIAAWKLILRNDVRKIFDLLNLKSASNLNCSKELEHYAS